MNNEEFDLEYLPEHLQQQMPEEPSSEDCCGSGCNTCIFDIYEQELKIWKEECRSYLKHETLKSASLEAAISATKYSKLLLLEIMAHTKDCNIYRFQLPKSSSLNLCLGQHMILREHANGKSIIREYTPISPPNVCGYFDVLIKIYNEGKMSQCILNWKTGMAMEWRGPQGEFVYQPNTYRTIYMIAAGTGITPMIHIIRHIIKNEDDETFLCLLYACRTYDDILMKSTLNEYKRSWNFKVSYFLSQELDHNCGAYNEEIHHCQIEGNILSEKVTIAKNAFLICGPKSFNIDMVKYLKNCGVPGEHCFVF